MVGVGVVGVGVGVASGVGVGVADGVGVVDVEQLPNKIETLVTDEPSLAVTRSCRPSLLKSPTATRE